MVNDDRLSGTNPFARVVDLSVDASRVHDGVARDFHGVRALEERFESEANGLAATREYPRGVDVAVDGGMVRDAVVFGDVVRTAPAEKFLLDGVAVGMFAYNASPRMARESSARLSCRGFAGL